MKNDFYEDLKFSEKASEEGFWQEVYQKAFSDMAFAQPVKGKIQSQYLGIDRVVHLGSGKTIYIDEKKRRKDWGDIALEYRHEGPSYKAPGWMNKKLLIDYLAYAFMPSKTVYLLDWLSLKRAWRKQGAAWHDMAKNKEGGFFVSEAPNKNYTTYSICVPIPVLLEEISKPIIVEL